MEEINLQENEKALHEMREKRQKSKKRKKIIIPLVIVGVIVLIVIIAVVVFAILGSKAPTVQVTGLSRGDIESTISITGIVDSDKKITYYAPASVKVTDIVKAGSLVKSGDVLVKFDEDDIAYQVAVATLQGNINENSYQQSLAQYNKSRSEYNAAKQKVTEYTDLVNAQQQVVDSMTGSVTDNKLSNYKEIYTRQNKISEIQAQMAPINAKIEPYQEALVLAINSGDNAAKEEAEASIESIKKESGYYELEAEINKVQVEIQQLSGAGDMIGTGSEEAKKQREAQELLAEYRQELETAKAYIKQYEASSTSYEKSGLELNKELADLQANHQMEELDKVLNGVVAEFDGVVAQTGISAGDTAITGSGVVTVTSMEDLYVSITVAKNDIKRIKEGQKATIKILDNEYTGTVESVSRMATLSDRGSSQVTAMVRIDNPDDKIYLGIDAKTTIIAAKAENCLMLPVEAVFSDDEGDFVYVVEDSIVHKQYITVGISSSRFIEVVDGLSEDALVMSTAEAFIVDGMVVNAVNKDAIMSAIGGAVVEETSEEVSVEISE